MNLLLALKALEDDLGPHGQPMSEAMSPLASGSKRQWHYEARGPFADNAAQVLAEAKEKYKKDWPNKSTDGLLWTVEKVDG